MAALDMVIKMDPPRSRIFIGDRINVIADVTANGYDMSGANVTFSSADGGSFAPSSGTSNTQGNVISTFTPDQSASGTITYEIVIVATMAGLDSVSKSTFLVVELDPVEHVTKDKEYHLLSYGIRQRLLDSLAGIMDEDPDLYVSTGATDKPRFLNGFSYVTRDFPQIVISGGTATSRRVGIGNSVGSNSIGSYPSTINHINLGGWYDMTINMTIIAEDKATQEKLLDKCIVILYAKEKWRLYAEDGILILDVSSGTETTQPYGSRLLYSGSVSLKCATEWFLKDRANESIEKFEHSVTIQ